MRLRQRIRKRRRVRGLVLGRRRRLVPGAEGHARSFHVQPRKESKR